MNEIKLSGAGIRVPITIFRHRPLSTDHVRRQHKHVFVHLYKCLTNTSVQARQIYTPTLPLAKDMALGRPTS